MDSYRPSQEEIEIFLGALDDRIDEWHRGSGLGMELSNYLGLSWTEYSYFAEHPRSFAHAQLLGAHHAKAVTAAK